MRGPGSKLFVHHWGLEGRLRGFPGLSPFMLEKNQPQCELREDLVT
jgi:hypothetical protein